MSAVLETREELARTRRELTAIDDDDASLEPFDFPTDALPSGIPDASWPLEAGHAPRHISEACTADATTWVATLVEELTAQQRAPFDNALSQSWPQP